MTLSTADTVSTPFSRRIREATMDAHRDAERTAFVRELIGGKLTQGQYAALVVQHRAIYAALEEGAEAVRGDAVAAAFLHPGLQRLSAIEADLKTLLKTETIAGEVTPATTAYCDRIRQVAATWPGGYVAHHYVRYLGDLSGGQVILRALGRAYGIDDKSGATFYRFDAVGDHDEFKNTYRDNLDHAAWDAAEQQRIVAEVEAAYKFNTAVFESLR